MVSMNYGLEERKGIIVSRIESSPVKQLEKRQYSSVGKKEGKKER